jgi:hypothetical protein
MSTPDAEAVNGDTVKVGQTTTGTVQTKVANSSATGGNAFVGQGADPNASGVVGSNTPARHRGQRQRDRRGSRDPSAYPRSARREPRSPRTLV